jgi:hypothetical protein
MEHQPCNPEACAAVPGSPGDCSTAEMLIIGDAWAPGNPFADFALEIPISASCTACIQAQTTCAGRSPLIDAEPDDRSRARGCQAYGSTCGIEGDTGAERGCGDCEGPLYGPYMPPAYAETPSYAGTSCQEGASRVDFGPYPAYDSTHVYYTRNEWYDYYECRPPTGSEGVVEWNPYPANGLNTVEWNPAECKYNADGSLNPAAQRTETIVPNGEHWQSRCYMPECERWNPPVNTPLWGALA